MTPYDHAREASVEALIKLDALIEVRADTRLSQPMAAHDVAKIKAIMISLRERLVVAEAIACPMTRRHTYMPAVLEESE